MHSKIRYFVGLDVHKDSIAIGYAGANVRQAPRFLGTTAFSIISLTKALRTLGPPEELCLCHEAGPCGYGLVRALRERGYATEVIAPSRVARQPADRIKTDRRDALLLARLHRSGELTPIVVPDPKDEAIRDLVRTREDAVNDLTRARQRLRSFLLRQGRAYTGRRWGPAHELFLSKIKFDNPAHHVSFTEYRLAVRFRAERVERLGVALREQVHFWRWLPVVHALMTLRAIDFISATTIVAELGDLHRFAHPRELMGYLGLVPSEHSSGRTTHRGGLTKTGNTHVRRILIEAAWNYRFAARIGESLQPRLQGQPQHIATCERADGGICGIDEPVTFRLGPSCGFGAPEANTSAALSNSCDESLITQSIADSKQDWGSLSMRCWRCSSASRYLPLGSTQSTIQAMFALVQGFVPAESSASTFPAACAASAIAKICL